MVPWLWLPHSFPPHLVWLSPTLRGHSLAHTLPNPPSVDYFSGLPPSCLRVCAPLLLLLLLPATGPAHYPPSSPPTSSTPPTDFPEAEAGLISSSNMTCPHPQLHNFLLSKSWRSQRRLHLPFLCSFTKKPDIAAGLPFHERLAWIFLLPLDCNASQHSEP